MEKVQQEVGDQEKCQNFGTNLPKLRISRRLFWSETVQLKGCENGEAWLWTISITKDFHGSENAVFLPL